MNPLDRELQNALRRQDPPADFAASLLGRLAREKSQAEGPCPEAGRSRFFTRLFAPPAWARWASAGALAAALIAGGLAYQRIEAQRARELAAGEAAKQQLVLALRIAGGKLQLARTKVNRTHGRRSHSGQGEN